MTNQEFFDRTMAHLRAQRVPSYVKMAGHGTGCAYRSCMNGKRWVMGSPETLMCAIGVHIPDSVIFESPVLNTTPYDNLLSALPQDVRAKFRDVDGQLARAMQMLHDHAAPSDDEELSSRRRYTEFAGDAFERDAQSIAFHRHLRYTPPQAK